MSQKDLVPRSPPPPLLEGERPTPNTLRTPATGPVARLLRSLRELPEAVREPGPGSTGLAGWFKAETPPPTDITARFREVHQRVREGEPVLPDEARRHLYLLVKGMLGDEMPGYLEDNQARLEKRGLETREVAVDTEGRLLDNVKVVREALLDALHFGRTVVLVGHSKGGVEALSTLALYPELRQQVRAVVTLQSPFGGSVIANDLVTTPSLRRMLDMTFPSLFQGDAGSVEDLSYARRMEFVRQHPHPVDIPTVSLATSRLSRRSLLRPLCAYVHERYGWACDGLVNAVDAEVPGSRVVRLDDMDHAEGALTGLPGFSNYFPSDITETMVALALESQP
ncbi:alpha/beta fold hydrolase [Archangium lansingense]|uniref:Alpha/beta fold hydrolase n=1 Tax=Archangium lansingense TaxID=2995310 RepID=A0ABT3ZZE9_9BACT|nr:alpha/beta fold hydrolase [Archangium lansinium]MCY1074787.1 alpha/beta fold hydrolase [Archangium lansinium]